MVLFFFFFFMLKVVICLVARWFLAASISFFWPCPHSCKISLPASSSMFRLKISKRKKRMVPAISVPFYQGSQSFSRCFNRFLLLSPLLVLSPSTPSCIGDQEIRYHIFLDFVVEQDKGKKVENECHVRQPTVTATTPRCPYENYRISVTVQHHFTYEKLRQRSYTT